ncbi:MAG: glycosyl hydrolase 53 family protein, partial [Bacteroidota bacterium]
MDIKGCLFAGFTLLWWVLPAQDFYLGADLSYVNEMNDCGGIYYDNGVEKDVYQIFTEYGANLIRFRLWHDPDSIDGYSFFNDVKRGIARAKAKNLQVLLNFHYSDIWADPGRQWKPAAWNEFNNDELLGDSLYQYTYTALARLNREGLLPEMVQIGNETNGNILQTITTDDLREESPNNYPVDWKRQVFLLNKGIQAVNDFNDSEGSTIKTILHIAQPENVIWWMDDAHANGILDFDIIGLSYYPKYSDYTIREVGESIKEYKERYGKEVMIVEVAYPWQGTFNLLLTHSAFHSPQNQFDFLTELTYFVKQNEGLGIIYWEPAWIDTECETLWGTGSSVVSELLFDESNDTHKGIEFYSQNHNIQPAGLAEQEVTFKVDMTGIDTKNGVYVTGDFTGDPWQFIPMENVTDQIYEYNTSLPGRSVGSYIFYNNNSWSTAYRETVPPNCALSSETHRKYWIENKAKELFFSWGRCDQVPNEVLRLHTPDSFKIFPTIVSEKLIVENAGYYANLEILNISGVQVDFKINNNVIDVHSLKSGIY